MRAAIRSVLFSAIQGIDLDFVRGRYASNSGYRSDFLGLPGATYTRAGAATAETAAGAIINFAANVPRITDRGVLIEEARTNLLLRSQEFDNAAWSKVEATVTANATAAPDGTTTADALVESSTAAAIHYVLPASGVGTITATETLSVYAKSAGRSWVLLQLGSGRTAYFNVSTGVIGTTGGGTTATITALANGWYRCAISGVRDANLNNIIYLASGDGVVSYTGNGTSGLFLWGAQLEAGAFPTSYIPTTAAAATRAADDMVLTGLNVRDGCTMYTEMLAPAGVTTDARIGLCDTSTSNQLRQVWTPSTLSPTAVLSGAGTVVGGATVAASAQIKAAFRHSAGVYSSSTNGGAVQTTVTTPLPVMTQYFVGRSASANVRHWNNYIRNVTIYQAALTDAQLQALTT